MIERTMKRIEETLQAADKMDPKRREELLALMGDLKEEVETLATSHRDEAESIAALTRVSTHEAVQENPNARLVDISMEGLTASVDEFKASNPRLVSVVNEISTFFAGLGI